MKKIVITGGTGFVGANLTRYLLKMGHEIHLFVRKNYKPWRLHGIEKEVQIHLIDLVNSVDLQKIIKKIKPDWIFHLSVFGAYSDQTDIHNMIKTNIVGTINLLQACKLTGFESFVNTGSSSEYGFKDHPPTENEFIDPNSNYAVTKATATMYCRYLAQADNLNIITLRLYSVYGPYEEPKRLIPNIIIKGFDNQFPPLVDPDISRDFVYIDDVCHAYIQSATCLLEEKGAIFNIGTGFQTRLRDVVITAKNQLGITAKPKWSTMKNRVWDTTCWVANNNKTINKLKWLPQFNFEQGLTKNIEWFRNNNEMLKLYKKMQI